MPPVRIPIPSLMGGVSQQPATNRHPHQVEAADNVLLTVTRGAEKRPGTWFINSPDTADGSLDASSPTNDKFVHWINRDADERFVVLVDPDASNPIEVFDLTGDKKTVAYSGSESDYVTSGVTDPAQEYALVTVADATFILNKTVVTAVKGMGFVYTNTDSTNFPNKKANGRNKATWDEFDQPPGNTEITTVPHGPHSVSIGVLSAAVNKDETFSAAPSGATGRIYGDAGTDVGTLVYTPTNGTPVASGDTLTFSGGATCTATANAVAPAAGYVWYSREDSPGHPSGFYKAVSDSNAPWYERLPVEAANSLIDETTMPVRMDHDGAGTFTVSFIDWDPRRSGDEETNKPPLFIGEPIVDLAFHRNRLWFAAGEKISSSRVGDFFNVWMDNFAELADDDPVNVQLSSNSVTEIDYLVPFSKSMVVLTSGARQFELTSPETMTPLSASFIPSTRYKSESYVRPVTLANQMYFVAERSGYTQIFEYYYNYEAVANVAVDVTAHVDTYIPTKVRQMAVSENNDFLFLVTSEDPHVIYVYKVFWNGVEKVQDAWCRWVFDEDNEILGIHVYDDELYILLRRSNKLWLERMSVIAPEADTQGGETMPYAILVDRLQYLTGSYDAATDTTTWTLPFLDSTIDEVILGPEWTAEKRVGFRLSPTNNSTGQVTLMTVSGDYSDHPAYVGRSYEMNLELSEQFVRDNSGQVVVGVTQLKTLFINHRNTGYYEVHVTPTGRETHVSTFTARRLGGLSTLLGRVQIEEEGVFLARIMASSNGTTIAIKNNTPLPCNITRLEFTANFTPGRKPRA